MLIGSCSTNELMTKTEGTSKKVAGLSAGTLGQREDDAALLCEALEIAGRENKVLREQLALLHSEIATLRGVSARFRRSIDRYAQSIGKPSSRSTLRSRSWSAWSAFAKRRTRWRIAWEAKQIEFAGIFDRTWYLRRYPDVEEAGVDPLRHYLEFGAHERREPHPLFDPNWYSATYREISDTWLTPLGHFATVGAANCYDPHPLFHIAWYVEQNPDVAATGLNPLRHYLEHGSEPGRNPNPLFDSAWYLSENREVHESGENPLVHYIHYGIDEMRNPHPLFDSAWYIQHYEHVAASGLDALEHYLTVGVFEGCRPGPADAEARPLRPPLRQPNSTKTNAVSIREQVENIHAEAPATDTAAWRVRLLPVASQPASAFSGQIGIFIHLFYEDLAEEIAASLRTIPFDYKVYISTTDQTKRQKIDAAFREFGIKPQIKIVRNRGWDIAPFVLNFRDEIKSHDICVKLHGKASIHGPKGAKWRHYLVSGLLGDAQNVSDIITQFINLPSLGILMLPHWKPIARQAPVVGANYHYMRHLLERVGLTISVDQTIDFPSGSMFWFRSKALAPLLNLGLTWEDFAHCRPRNVDATIAHAIERSILIFAALAGYNWSYHTTRRRWRRILGQLAMPPSHFHSAGLRTNPDAPN